MNIYIDTVRRFVRANNTDWQYNFMLGQLSAIEPSLQLYYPNSRLQELRVNLNYCRDALAYRLSRFARLRHFFTADDYSDRLCEKELRDSNCEVVFSHRDFPVNAGSVPVIWHNSILDPRMSLARGISPSVLAREVSIKRILFRRAARVQVPTHAEAARLGALMPEIADRFMAVPFFLPYLEGIAEETVRRKHSDPDCVHFVFVGREARRKGLPELLDALSQLDFGSRHDVRMTIVSDFRDGSITLPAWDNLRWHKSMPRQDVAALFNDAHVLLMPSRFESYGFVYLEAMSRGMVPIVPDWEVQRELVDNGSCGLVVGNDPVRIANAIEELAADAVRRSSLALSALRRFNAHYAPNVVAKRYSRLFEDATRAH
jgi:glycosyltransferase involved in cell wall biosynthesis